MGVEVATASGAAPEARGASAEALPGRGLPAYRPPPSPAYAPHPEPVVPKRARTSPSPSPAASPSAGPAVPAASTDTPRETAPATPATVAEPTTGPRAAASDRRLGWQLLIAGLVLVVVAGAVAVLAIQSRGDGDAHAFGEVSAVTGDVVVRPGSGADLRVLEVGDQVVAGGLADAPAGATATIDLAGNGVVRIDSGTRLRFVDLALDPDTGERDRASEPAVDISGGRARLPPGPPRDGARGRGPPAHGRSDPHRPPVPRRRDLRAGVGRRRQQLRRTAVCGAGHGRGRCLGHRPAARPGGGAHVRAADRLLRRELHVGGRSRHRHHRGDRQPGDRSRRLRR